MSKPPTPFLTFPLKGEEHNDFPPSPGEGEGGGGVNQMSIMDRSIRLMERRR
jgi:hypothetical protein